MIDCRGMKPIKVRDGLTKRIIEHFAETGRTQREWYVAAGISQSVMSRIIQGQRRPSVDVLFRLVYAIADDLILPAENGEGEGDGPTTRLPPEGEIVLEMIRDLGGFVVASKILLEVAAGKRPLCASAPTATLASASTLIAPSTSEAERPARPAPIQAQGKAQPRWEPEPEPEPEAFALAAAGYHARVTPPVVLAPRKKPRQDSPIKRVASQFPAEDVEPEPIPPQATTTPTPNPEANSKQKPSTPRPGPRGRGHWWKKPPRKRPRRPPGMG